MVVSAPERPWGRLGVLSPHQRAKPADRVTISRAGGKTQAKLGAKNVTDVMGEGEATRHGLRPPPQPDGANALSAGVVSETDGLEILPRAEGERLAEVPAR
jgi:hypothetical protein